MNSLCDLCGSGALERVYEPDGTTRGLSVHVCTHCGLVQSLPRADRAGRRDAAVSARADWGNVRYGKGFRAAGAVEALARHACLASLRDVLDAGANRGAFIAELRKHAPNARIAAVEPDERFVAAYEGKRNIETIRGRIEDTGFADARFDLIHSSHTLEHLASPRAALADHWRTLKPGGLLYLEVPNIALIASPDIVEEWFIDKHLFHFSAVTLGALLHRAGFAPVEGPDPQDRTNIAVVARKTLPASGIPGDSAEAATAFRLIADYRLVRARNLRQLERAAQAIAGYGAGRTAIWGAGRLFDGLVQAGLKPRTLCAVVDKHLPDEARNAHGIAIARPQALIAKRPECIIIMSRGFAHEIAAEARALVPGARIVAFASLLAGAPLAAEAADA